MRETERDPALETGTTWPTSSTARASSWSCKLDAMGDDRHSVLVLTDRIMERVDVHSGHSGPVPR